MNVERWLGGCRLKRVRSHIVQEAPLLPRRRSRAGEHDPGVRRSECSAGLALTDRGLQLELEIVRSKDPGRPHLITVSAKPY